MANGEIHRVYVMQVTQDQNGAWSIDCRGRDLWRRTSRIWHPLNRRVLGELESSMVSASEGLYHQIDYDLQLEGRIPLF